MSHHPENSDKKEQFLRQTAESRLGSGSAPASGLPLDREALTVLHEMAGDSSRSSDALKLLQELQVHQVELDLQREELEINEHELNRELSHYRELFALMPVACLVTTMEGRVVEANPAAVGLLDTGHGELGGKALHDLLAPGSHAAWNAMIRTLEAGAQAASCEVFARRDADEAEMLRLSANVFAGRDALLLTVTGS